MPDNQLPEDSIQLEGALLERKPRKARKRAFKIDHDEVTKRVLDGLRRDLDDREPKMTMRAERNIKIRGWGDTTTNWPWEGAANYPVPIIMIALLRTKAGMENALKAMHPMLMAKALQKENQGKEEPINDLLDYQFFIENMGEKKIDAFVSNLCEDEAAYIFSHYVREEETVHDIKVLEGLDPLADYIPQLLLIIQEGLVLPEVINATQDDKDGWVWEVEYKDENRITRAARVEFFERDDEKLEAHIAKKVRIHDGPFCEILDFEDVVFPARSGNLQPPSAANPYGAEHVNRHFKISLDGVKRGKAAGIYDLITDEDLEELENYGSPMKTGNQIERAKEAKDEQEGVVAATAAGRSDLIGIEHYGRWDVNGDGLEEDVIFWLVADTGFSNAKILKATYLTEQYPTLPPRRPFSHDAFINIPNRVLGISLAELLESTQDISQRLMNQHINWGDITNAPVGFYRASSSMKPENIWYEPGELIALDDPQNDISFPQWPTKDGSYTLNTMGLVQQFAERLQMFSDVSVGRIPTGKASAMRNVGTVTSLLGQADVRSEQVLRRALGVLGEVYQSFHSLNKKFLPAVKQFRMIGVSAENDPYKEVKPEDITADVNFEFKATMFNTNKQMLAQSLREAIALTISPLAMQAGIITAEEFYKLLAAMYRALELDPDEFLHRPAEMDMGPKLLAEDVLSMIIDGQVPMGRPAEAFAELHLQKLTQLIQDPRFAQGINAAQQVVLQGWIQNVQQLVQREQLMQQAAASFQGQARQGQEGEGGGGSPSVIAPPEMPMPGSENQTGSIQ